MLYHWATGTVVEQYIYFISKFILFKKKGKNGFSFSLITLVNQIKFFIQIKLNQMDWGVYTKAFLSIWHVHLIINWIFVGM